MAHRTSLAFAKLDFLFSPEGRRRENIGEVLMQTADITKKLEKKFVFIVKGKVEKDKLTILWEKYDKYLRRDIRLFFKHPKCYKKRTS